MSKSSQKYFQHSIPKDFGKFPRISITLRLLKHCNVETEIISTQEVCDVLDGLEFASSQNQQNIPTTISEPTHSATDQDCSTNSGKRSINHCPPPVSKYHPTTTKSTTIYLSSSMFRYLKAQKLCSKHQDAHVFFYSGATAGEMLTRFSSDHRLQQIDLSQVNNFFILTGSNNVDGIMNDPNGNMYNNAVQEINNLLDFVHNIAPNSTINMINLLPRTSYKRNVAINQLNSYLYTISQQCHFIKYVDTECERNLFCTTDGYRRNSYFIPASNRIPDNVHLNQAGVIRLAKHIKYLAHCY